MKFTIKNSRSCMGRDGLAWSATLYIDGVKAADATNSGNGGETDIYWYNKDLQKKFEDYVNAMPLDMTSDVRIYPNGRKIKVDEIFSQLVDEYENEKRHKATLKRWCKTKTIFRLKEDKKDEYRNVKSPFSPAVKTYLVGKYGDTIEKIFNEDPTFV